MLVGVSAVSTVGLSTLEAGPAHAAVGAPFSCSSEIDFLSQGDPDTQLYEGTYGSGTATYTKLGAAQPEVYNALGYDPTNNYLYGTYVDGENTTGSPGTLYQIDSTGTSTSLGVISGYPAASGYPADGAFDASGDYWITGGGTGATTAYEINVGTSPPVVIKTLTLSATWMPLDFTLDDGYMWGLDTRFTDGSEIATRDYVYRLNLSTGQVSTFVAPSAIASSDESGGFFGAASTTGSGNLRFSDNGTGNIYEMSVANPSGTPTFAEVGSYTGPVAGLSNDGAACIGTANVDLGIAKAGPATIAPSGTISWTLTVTNDGPANSSAFSVSDPVPAGVTNVATTTAGCSAAGNQVSCSEGALSNGSTFTIVVTGKAPSTEGTCFTNTATVNGNEVDPNSGNNSSSLQTCTTGISLVKSANPTSFTGAGQTVHYSYVVKNTGTVSLSNVTVTDNKLASSAINCGSSSNVIATLAATASVTCTASYTTTLADVSGGSISNTGTAVGTPTGGANVSATSSVTIPYSHITLAKSANPTSFTAAGQTITYSYLVTDTGTTTVNALSVTDPMPGLSAINCGGTTSLAPLASVTCTATHTTTAGDVSDGSIANTGTAAGTDQDGNPVGATSSVTVPYSHITLAKSANPTSFTAAGQTITYSYLVTNTGTTTVNALSVTDPMPGLSAVNCGGTTSLAPLASVTCTATHTTTAGDVSNGSIANTGTATGTDQDGNPVGATSSATVPYSHITLAKSANPTSFTAAGQTITYSYLVTNTGTTTVNALSVTDPMPGLSAVNCGGTTSLAPLASVTCTATYTTTAGDVSNGSIANTGTATGTDQDGNPVGATSSVSIPYVATAPNAPTGVKAVTGRTTTTTGSLTVTYTPGPDNGSTFTQFTAACTSTNGGAAKTGTHSGATAAPIMVTRVTTKKTYRCTVAATNTVGTGPASAASAPVIVGSPAAPSKVKAVSGSTTATTGSLRVTFTLGTNSGSAISSQTATCASSNGGVTRTGTHRGGNAASITVTGVTTGKIYTCTVAATNARGRGLASARSLPVVVGSPAVPTRVAATHVAAGQIKVTFTPGSDDGSRITGYTASCTSSNGGVLGTKSGRAAPLTVIGLTAGDSYRCTVTAVNARGRSPVSTTSGVVRA